MPALAPVESEDEAAAVADGEAEVPVVAAPFCTEVVDAAVVFVGADVGVLELVVLAEVTVEISKPGLEICPVLSSNVSLLAMKRKTHSFVTASSEEGNFEGPWKGPSTGHINVRYKADQFCGLLHFGWRSFCTHTRSDD
jgi:hypothetical protein